MNNYFARIYVINMKHTLKMKKIKKRKNLGDQSRLEYLDEQI